MAQPLSLQTSRSGSCQAAARLRVSRSMPWFIAPSPKNATATDPGRSARPASANPAPSGAEEPTIPDAAARSAFDMRCMWPARPRSRPALQPEHLGQHRGQVDAEHRQDGSRAVVERHRVAGAQGGDDPRGDGLLPGAEVHLAGDAPLAPERREWRPRTPGPSPSGGTGRSCPFTSSITRVRVTRP